jgi:hypothetical protein
MRYYQECFYDRDLAKGGISDGASYKGYNEITCTIGGIALGGNNDGSMMMSLTQNICTDN